MGDRNQEPNTKRRTRRTVFKGPIHGFIRHASSRREVVAYNELVDERGSSPTRLANELESDTSGGEPLSRGSTNEHRATDNPPRGNRRIQQAQRPPSQDMDLAESRAILEDLLRRAGMAGAARSPNQARTDSTRKIENQENRASDERILDSENEPVFNFTQLENEFHQLSPSMQRYLSWLQTATQSKYLFTRRDQAAWPQTHGVSQR